MITLRPTEAVASSVIAISAATPALSETALLAHTPTTDNATVVYKRLRDEQLND